MQTLNQWCESPCQVNSDDRTVPVPIDADDQMRHEFVLFVITEKS